MYSITRGCRHSQKDRSFMLPHFRNKSRALSKDDKLEGSSTPLSPLTDPVVGPIVSSVLKYFE